MLAPSQSAPAPKFGLGAEIVLAVPCGPSEIPVARDDGSLRLIAAGARARVLQYRHPLGIDCYQVGVLTGPDAGCMGWVSPLMMQTPESEG
jgi:hypothetical protein